MTSEHVCSFSGGLAELSKRDQRSGHAVLEFLKIAPKFSTFDAASSKELAKTITSLREEGLLKIENLAFPWHRAKITAAGRRLLLEERPRG